MSAVSEKDTTQYCLLKNPWKMKTAVDKGKSFGALLTGLSKDLIRLAK